MFRLLLVCAASQSGIGENPRPTSSHVPYHLTARPWRQTKRPKSATLDDIERLCRFIGRHQEERGAIIDPLLKREHQYSTPYFAFAVGVLVDTDRAPDLLPRGIRAMEHASGCVAEGHRGIPDGHGEFFLAPLTRALALYHGHVPTETLGRWRRRMRTPLMRVIEGRGKKINNWRTYAMKGEWLRHRAGLSHRDRAVAFIEDAWLNRTQRQRIAPDVGGLYQDWSSDPQSHAVEAVGRVNLLDLLASGYDGPSGEEMRTHVERGSGTALLLQDPTGQCPPNGRTDDHVFNDVLYALGFEMMAERAAKHGNAWTAGQYRRAAVLGLRSIRRWRRADPPWRGMYSITKNHFPPRDRVGYQPASNIGNYTGAVMAHLAEAYLCRETAIIERPAPTEIGGYAVAMDPRFGSVVANAGGMQVFANLRGDTVAKYGTFWTPLGVVRFSRVGWDSRLGPSDGVYDARARRGLTFGPTWQSLGKWVRIAEKARHYRGTFEAGFVHPLLVRCSILYHPVTGMGGPIFRHDFVVTPDGVLATLRCVNDVPFGVTLPLLVDDGRKLRTSVCEHHATTSYPEGLGGLAAGRAGENGQVGNKDIGGGDEQCFIAVAPGTALESDGKPLQSTYGWLQSVRATADKRPVHVFVYPRSAADPPAEAVREGFRLLASNRPSGLDFTCVLGRVKGTLYVGRTSAGGYGDRIDLDEDGKPDVTFDRPCGFVLQLDAGNIVAVEADRDVTVTMRGRTWKLRVHEPRGGDRIQETGDWRHIDPST